MATILLDQKIKAFPGACNGFPEALDRGPHENFLTTSSCSLLLRRRGAIGVSIQPVVGQANP